MISHWLGWFSFAFCIILMLKFVARKTKISPLNLFFRKIHKPCGILLLTTGLLHGLIAFAKVSYRTIPIITGILTIVLILFISATYIFRIKIKKKWMKFHRFGTMVLIPVLLMHLLSVL